MSAPALRVRGDDVVERLERAVMHVRAANSDVAQRGHLELTQVGILERDFATPFVGVIRLDAVVSKGVVAEVEAGMTVKTLAALAVEQSLPADGRLAQRARVAGEV